MSNQIESLTWSDGASIAGVVAASAAVVALLVSVIGDGAMEVCGLTGKEKSPLRSSSSRIVRGFE